MNCGEIKSGESWNYCEKDETEDIYPPYPDDWEYDNDKINIENVVMKIKNAGNFYFKRNNLKNSGRKYQKALRYINWYTKLNKNFNSSRMFMIKIKTLLNMATVNFRQQKYKDAISLCTQVLVQLLLINKVL